MEAQARILAAGLVDLEKENPAILWQDAPGFAGRI